MFSIRPLPEFNAWIDGLKDEADVPPENSTI
jgi:hypothetical protein